MREGVAREKQAENQVSCLSTLRDHRYLVIITRGYLRFDIVVTKEFVVITAQPMQTELALARIGTCKSPTEGMILPPVLLKLANQPFSVQGICLLRRRFVAAQKPCRPEQVENLDYLIRGSLGNLGNVAKPKGA